MIRQPIKPHYSAFISVATFAALIIGYAQLSATQHAVNANDSTIPSFTQLWDGIQKIIEAHPRTGERWIIEDTLATLGRLFLGLSYGVGGALVIGVFMGCFAQVEAAFKWMLGSFAKIPPTAMMAVFFVLVDKEADMYPVMIGFGILPTLALAVDLAAKDVPEELVNKAYTLGASTMEVIWDVICKTTFPRMLDAIRLQIGPAMVFLIAAEMVVGDVGFGYRIRLQSRLLNMDVVYPYLVVLMIFGFAMDYGLRLLQRKACPWYAPEKG